eukprot:326127-Lingulodinium_polyedra.AAC.1
MSSQQTIRFGEPRAFAFLGVAEHVAKRTQAYRWPAAFDLRVQYRDCVLHWRKLCKRPNVSNEIRRPKEDMQSKGGGQQS